MPVVVNEMVDVNQTYLSVGVGDALTPLPYIPGTASLGGSPLHSPRSSPRVSPRSSPRVSPRGSPRSSPRRRSRAYSRGDIGFEEELIVVSVPCREKKVC